MKINAEIMDGAYLNICFNPTKFSQKEMTCKCGCGEHNMNAKLINKLDAIRTLINKPIRINSGRRCKKYNTKIGGASKSKHLTGCAADISIRGFTGQKLFKFIELSGIKFGGMGLYKNFVHLDVRKKITRWGV